MRVGRRVAVMNVRTTLEFTFSAAVRLPSAQGAAL
jgi:hypothetical protein